MSIPSPQHFSFQFDGEEQFLTPKYTYKSNLNDDSFTETLDITFYITNEGFNSNVTYTKHILLKMYKQDGSVLDELNFKVKRAFIKTFSGDWGSTSGIATVVVRYEIESIAENHFSLK